MINQKIKRILLKHKKDITETVIIGLLLFSICFTSFYNYLLFHSLSELFSSIIAGGIFVIGWNTRKYSDSSFFLVLGISSLYVGLFDFLHTLAYPGIGIFIGYDTNLTVQLWTASRYLQGISILLASIVISKKINPYNLIMGYTLISSFLILIIFLNIFPVCYIEGVRLTPFKIVSEYIIILILTLSIFVIYRSREEFAKRVYRLIIVSIMLFIISEFAFTLYVGAFDIANFIGHLLKIVAFFHIYRSIIQIGLKDPLNNLFRKITISEESLREALNRSNFYKDLFTHDISNIVQNFSSSIELLKIYRNEFKPSIKLNEILNIMDEQIIRGMNLIKSVRKLSKIEDSGLILKPIDIYDHLIKVIEYIKKGYQNKNIIFQFEKNDDNFYIEADELIQDVFENILINSIRYNQNSPITIEVRMTRIWENGSKFIKLEFMDNGIGIEDFRKKIIFVEGHRHEKGGKGMGLGLSLISKIVHSYGGKIWVEDKVKGEFSKGSNFILLLPEAIEIPP